MSGQKNIRALYQTLAETIADIVGHDDCPAVVCNSLSECLDSIINSTGVSNVPNFARFLLVPALVEITEAASTQSKTA